MSIVELSALGVAGEGSRRRPTAPTPGRRPGAQVGQRPGVPETGTGPSPTLVPWVSLAPGEKRLVICEKPSAAKDVAAALGGARRFGDRFESSDTIVAWAFGHLLEPVSPEVYDRAWKDWSYAALPYLPEPFRYAPRDPRAAHQLAALHALVARADVVALVNACDAGREGELIFKLIVQAAPKGATKPIMRAWFNSMTAPAILAAFAALRPDAAMGPLEDAARCRQEADWLLGINATRAATVQVGGGSMISLGRVQTPTLALIARRDTVIDAFVASPFWQIRAHFTARGGTYEGLWVGDTGDRFVVEAAARAAAAEVRAGAYATVAAVDVKAISEQAPQLFDLTTLQREANRRWSWSAARTLGVAQACYEKFKLLTYPRTDSRYLTTAMIPELGATAGHVGAAVAALARPAGVVVTAAGARLPKRIVDDAKVSDHHAIIPTNAPHALGAADNDARQLYDLVARRFLAAFHPAARLERTLVWTEVEGASGPHRFRTSGTAVLDPGWRSVERAEAPSARKKNAGNEAGDNATGDHDENVSVPPGLAAGDRAKIDDVDVAAGTTKPPARFNEASLLGAMTTAGSTLDDEDAAEAMKDRGLGTPATRASIIERLITVGYVDRKGRQLIATSKGRGIIALLGDHELTRPDMTGEWEKRLRDMEAGRERRSVFMSDIEAFARRVVGDFGHLDRSRLQSLRPAIADCPRCDGHIVEGAKGWVCTSWKSPAETGCGYVVWKTTNKTKVTLSQLKAKIAANICDAERTRMVLGPCPSPGCTAEIVERPKSYGCTSWKSKDEPGCDYTIWKQVAGATVSLEQATAMVARGVVPDRPTERAALCGCPHPKCSGTLRQQRSAKGWSCDSWKSARHSGCGTVIWKSGRDGATLDEAAARVQAETLRQEWAGRSSTSAKVPTASKRRGPDVERRTD